MWQAKGLGTRKVVLLARINLHYREFSLGAVLVGVFSFWLGMSWKTDNLKTCAYTLIFLQWKQSMHFATTTFKPTRAKALLRYTTSHHRTLAHFPNAPTSLATSFQHLLDVLKTGHSSKVRLNMVEALRLLFRLKTFVTPMFMIPSNLLHHSANQRMDVWQFTWLKLLMSKFMKCFLFWLRFSMIPFPKL